MKRTTILLTGTLVACLLSVQALAQEHFTRGPVWRVTYIDVKPGKFDEVMTDLRQHWKVIQEEAKRQGVIVDYKVFLNPEDIQPNDWDIALAIQYMNWAALDGLPEKMGAISLKHYGSEEAREAAAAKRRELGQVVASRLVREVTLR